MVERAIAFVCSRNHLSASDADDFSSYVTLRMVEDDYEVFSQFQGRASLRTYLTVVIQRMLLDYRVRAWGRWRPSAEAKRRGPLAIRLEELLVRDGWRPRRSLRAAEDQSWAGGDARRAGTARRAPGRRARRGDSSLDDALATVASEDRAADEKLVKEGDRQELAARVSRALRRVMAGLEQEDQLILVLKFEDGRTVAEIAATLRLESKALYRRVERLLGSFVRGSRRKASTPRRCGKFSTVRGSRWIGRARRP